MAIITKHDHEIMGKILYSAMVKSTHENVEIKKKINIVRDILDDVLCEEYDDIAEVYYNLS